MVKPGDFKARSEIDWCPGCGNFGIVNALKRALTELEIGPSGVAVVSGIGCSAKLPHFMNLNGFHSIHGRALPVATGIKLASGDLPVIAVTGDGDGLSIGGAHFINTTRRNVDIAHILHNNAVYGLTTGQIAPTSAHGMKTKTTPRGSPEEPIQPVPLALASGASFVARTFVADFKQTVEIFRRAIEHKGYALVDTLQPCVTFNRINTYEWYAERVYQLADEGHDPTDMQAALLKGYEWDDRIPLGVFYQVERPTLSDQLIGLKKGPLNQRDISNIDVSMVMDRFN